MESYLEVIGQNVDQIISLELRDRRPDQGVIGKLYQAARQKFGAPLAMLAAQRLTERVGAGDIVFLVTGAGGHMFLPTGETDGPLGTAALARILRYGIGAIPVILTEEAFVENIRATCIAAGLGIRDLEEARQVPYTGTVRSFPGDESAAQVAQDLIGTLQPRAIISIEKLGPNEAGIAHNATGNPVWPYRARVEYLFDLAAQHDILTIGIGDNGNEIGFGAIREAVWEYKQWGKVCRCPCGKGIATRVGADVLVVAGISNWGAYGIEACLAAFRDDPDLIHSPDAERWMLLECVRTGAADGGTGRHEPGVDGTSGAIQPYVVELLRAVVAQGIAPPRQRGW